MDRTIQDGGSSGKGESKEAQIVYFSSVGIACSLLGIQTQHED